MVRVFGLDDDPNSLKGGQRVEHLIEEQESNELLVIAKPNAIVKT
jgi:hypothetical protein